MTMTFDEIRKMTDGQVLRAIRTGGFDVPSQAAMMLDAFLCMLLEEKLRERYPGSVHIGYEARVTWMRLGPSRGRLEWPATVSPCRVRADAFLLAFGGDK